MAFAVIIRIPRQRAFLSQEAFAKEINSSVASINRWENGRGKPNLPYEDIEKEWLCRSKEEH